MRINIFAMRILLLVMGTIIFGYANSVNSSESSIHYAAKDGRFSEVKSLLEKNQALLNQKEPKYGTTPLHQAVGARQYEITRFLLEKGADVNATDFNGATPLHYAADYRSPVSRELVDLLIKYKVNVNAKKKDGMTPLHVASFTGKVEMAGILIKNGGDINAIMDDNNTPLHLATLTANEGMAIFLIRPDNVNLIDNGGNTALHFAAARNLPLAVLALINNGARINQINKAGKTPLAIAIQNKSIKVIDILKKNGGY